MAKKQYPVCPVSELPPGEHTIVDIGRRSIGVYNLKGQFYAIKNSCPHQFAPLCKGPVGSTTTPGTRPGEFKVEREGQIVRCPWHKWEFDITTGKSVFNPHKCRVATYEVTVENEDGSGTRKVTISSDDEDPSVETYEVTVEEGVVTLHV